MMSHTTQIAVGSVVSLRRYPVKSMMGEELNAADVTACGLLGDRAYALLDPSNGHVVSAKNPRKWAKLFDCRAAFVEPPRAGEEIPPARITLPDGTVLTSAQGDLPHCLSTVLGREVTLAKAAPLAPRFEQYWPAIQGLAHRDTITEYAMPAGTFFDSAAIHLLTTATIDRLRDLYPQGRFEVRRFRPNIVVEPTSGAKTFVEQAWIGHTLAIGDDVRLRVTAPCPRCVMTTLSQDDLPQDPGILRTAAQHNQAVVGVYADVLQDGAIRRGDPVRLE
jgi:MOSC domain-containing protein